jgi:hypothetical protein
MERKISIPEDIVAELHLPAQHIILGDTGILGGILDPGLGKGIAGHREIGAEEII